MTEGRQVKAPTIIDIAREAGVSKSVVSRALLAQGGVNKETRRRVAEVAERLGYVKNAMAQGLVAQRTHTIGVLVRNVTNPFYGHLQAALEERAAQRGYRVVATTGTGAFELTQERKALQTLLSLRVEGLVVCSGLLSAADITPFVQHVPTVVAGRPERDPALGSVYCDEQDGAAQLVSHLTGLGHRRVGVLRVPRRLSITQYERGTAMERELREAGAEPVVVELDERPDSVARAIGTLTAARDGAEAVTAAMCPSDHAVLRAVEALQALGLSAPGNMSLTGFDGVAPLSTPLLGLTTLRQPVPEIGRRAIDLVLDQPDARPDDAPHLGLQGTLVIGRTTAPPHPRG
ncbi:LacI family DNA-binding transcriptional regulator [Streptomyces sp. NPDC057199]|uniref:LacI family DNA-binding transcriptional regulator n=1 Tax=Streptomyces sp. NPDC057199 TaxID=3346047 RepID=UPI00363BD5A3